MTGRWIRALVRVDDKREPQYFTDVGPDELREIKKKYKKVVIEYWGRYENPRHDAEVNERKIMEKILESG